VLIEERREVAGVGDGAGAVGIEAEGDAGGEAAAEAACEA